MATIYIIGALFLFCYAYCHVILSSVGIMFEIGTLERSFYNVHFSTPDLDVRIDYSYLKFRFSLFAFDVFFDITFCTSNGNFEYEN